MSLLHSIQPAVVRAVRPEASRITSLPILLLNIHTLCNCRCVMCDIWQRKDSRQRAAATLNRHRESLIHLGVRQVVLSGGEPLLNRELPEILAFFRSLSIRITLLTTGLLLKKQARVVSASVDEIILSIDGPPEVHNTIRGIPRAFQTIARGIDAVRQLNPSMAIACRATVQKLNHKHLRATVDAVRTLGLDSVSFLSADLSSAAFNRERPWSSDRQSEVALDSSELQALEDEIEMLIASYKAEFNSGFIKESDRKLRNIATRFREHLAGDIPSSPKCNAPWVSVVMEVDGALRPCFFHPVKGSADQMPLEAALNTNAFQAFRSQLDVATNPTCKRCVCSLNYMETIRIGD